MSEDKGGSFEERLRAARTKQAMRGVYIDIAAMECNNVRYTKKACGKRDTNAVRISAMRMNDIRPELTKLV